MEEALRLMSMSKVSLDDDSEVNTTKQDPVRDAFSKVRSYLLSLVCPMKHVLAYAISETQTGGETKVQTKDAGIPATFSCMTSTCTAKSTHVNSTRLYSAISQHAHALAAHLSFVYAHSVLQPCAAILDRRIC